MNGLQKIALLFTSALTMATAANAQLGSNNSQAIGNGTTPVCKNGEYKVKMNAKLENATGIYLPKGSSYQIIDATEDPLIFGDNIGSANPLTGFSGLIATWNAKSNVSRSYSHGATLMEFRNAENKITELSSLEEAMDDQVHQVTTQGGAVYLESNDIDKPNNKGIQWVTIKVGGCPNPVYMPGK